MPFVAERDGDLVTPNMVDTETAVVCPACGEEMTVRIEHERDDSFVARHFVHGPDTDCDGESDKHLRMKAIAHSKLAVEYPDAEVTAEEPVGDRQADLVVEFPEPREPLGRGIAVEVQHRNKSKDREATTEHYHAHGYSTLWLYDYHYRGRNVRVEHVEPVWPNAISHVDYREAYPDVIRHDGWPEVTLHVPLPDDATTIGREGRRDLRWHWLLGCIDATRDDAAPPTPDGDWTEVTTNRLGIDGGRGEITLLGTPDGELVMQFTKVGDRYADMDLGVRLAPSDDVRRLVKFALDIDEMWDTAARHEGIGVWDEHCSMRLGEGDHRTKWIEFCADPKGKPALKLCKKNPQEPDIPIRIDRLDVEEFFDVVASVAAHSDVRHLQQVGNQVVTATPTSTE